MYGRIDWVNVHNTFSYISLLTFICSPYRAPELLFGPKSYNAFAADLWSLGTTLSELFTPLELVPSSSSSSSSPYLDHGTDSSSEPEQTHLCNGAFIVPSKACTGTTTPNPDTKWTWLRKSLFDGTRGELGLLWSVFKTMGTPNDQTWPVSFKTLIDFFYILYLRRVRDSKTSRRDEASRSTTSRVSRSIRSFPIYHHHHET